MEWNTVERIIETETDTRTAWRKSGQARLVYVKNIHRNIPTTWRWQTHRYDLFKSIQYEYKMRFDHQRKGLYDNSMLCSCWTGTDPLRANCQEACKETLPCGHRCQNKCGQACTRRCQVMVTLDNPHCGHQHEAKCSERDTAVCSHPCGWVQRLCCLDDLSLLGEAEHVGYPHSALPSSAPF